MFIYCLVDEHGDTLTSLPPELEDVHFSYAKVNAVDTLESDSYMGGVDTVYTMEGTYVVGMNWICDPDDHEHTRRMYVNLGEMTVNTTYVAPNSAIIARTATTVDGYGTHPTLSCFNTGRVQFKIENGKMPYYLELVNEDGDTVRRFTFDELHHGTDEPYDNTNDTKYNYKDYYTVDSLSAGTWKFRVRDACSYGMAAVIETIEEVSLPLVDQIDIYASTGKRKDSNIVKVKAHMGYPYEYYIRTLNGSMSYRIIKGDSPGTDEPWRTFPNITTSQIDLYDTLPIHSYCELLRETESIHFQYRISVDGCEDTIVDRYFHYKKPAEDKFKQGESFEPLSLQRIGNDPNEPCRYGYWRYTKERSIRYNSYKPNNANPNDDHGEYRYHYTEPLTWVITDRGDESDTLKVDTVSSIEVPFTLSLEEAGFSLQQLDATPTLTKNVSAKLYDAYGCELYSGKFSFEYKLMDERIKPEYEITTTSGNHCCETPREITVRTKGVLKDSVIIDSIKLIQSPLGNRYNFYSTFNRANLTWLLFPATSNVQNSTTVLALRYRGEITGRSLTIEGNCLPSGTYKFVIVTACGYDTISKSINFPDVYIMDPNENPVHALRQECSDLYVTYTQGNFKLTKSNQNQTTGEPVNSAPEDYPARFKVISGPHGGYDNIEYKIGDAPLRFTLWGEYIVEMYPKDRSSVCEQDLSVYDTIVFEGARVNLDFEGALKCRETDEFGNVYIGAKDGTAPYTYILYNNPDAVGTPLVSVTVNANGIVEQSNPSIVIEREGLGVRFKDIPMEMGRPLSCIVRDSCGIDFPVKLFPQSLATMQKVWFDNDQREMVVCTGDSVQVHALEYGHFFSYTWSHDREGLDIISIEANPYLSVPRHSTSGIYYVKIDGHGCVHEIRDSIILRVKESPYVNLHFVTLHDTTVICPGETMRIRVTPHTSSETADSIGFTLAFANEMGIETRSYKVDVNEDMYIDYSTLYPTHIYAIQVDDDICNFHQPEDSIMVETNTANMLNNCNLLTIGDTICEGVGAELVAKAQGITAPYTIHWYRDFELTSLAQVETMMDMDTWSYYHTSSLMEDTALYVKVSQENTCASHHSIATKSINLADGVDTTVKCDDVVRLYDSGGPNANYNSREEITTVFRSEDGRPLTVHFENLNLAYSSTLFVFSGDEANTDSTLCILTPNRDIPDIIVSNSDALTFYFASAAHTASGWSALIQPTGSMAVARVNHPVYTIIKDEVCQKSGDCADFSRIYEDPYHVVGEIVSAAEIKENIKQAGTYFYRKTYPRERPLCDSTVSFQLTVNHPGYRSPTNVVTTTLEPNYPYIWYDDTLWVTDQYYHLISGGEGECGQCDEFDVLNLVVLEINSFTDSVEICKGKNATLAVQITPLDLPPVFTQLHQVGDVLCRDIRDTVDTRYIMNPDSLLNDPNKVALGVVFYLDPFNNNKGKAIALRDAYEGYSERGSEPARFQGECIWASETKPQGSNRVAYKDIHSKKMYGISGSAVYDMNGEGNTDTIKKSTYNIDHINPNDPQAEEQMPRTFKKFAPAAYYCYYYNADSARNLKGYRTNGDNASPIPSGWYLPSLGELELYFANRLEVSRTLEMLLMSPYNATLMQGRIDVKSSKGDYKHDESYWTSTEYNENETYRLSGKGQLIYNKSEYSKAKSTNNPTFVRAIINF